MAKRLSILRPFQSLKKLMPKTLLGRSLVILITPMVLVQLIIGYVFWDRHWTKHTEKISDQVAGNIAAVLDLANSTPDLPQQFPGLQDFTQTHFDMTLNREDENLSFSDSLLAKTGWREAFLRDSLNRRVSYPFRVRVFKHEIRVQVMTLKGLFDFSMSRRILFSRTVPIFVWWAVGAPIFLLIIAIIFMRNQIRPLRNLSEKVEEFGKGRDIGAIRPAGALEIRRVIRAFNDMRDRIQRQISQRTAMLAGISHDLKTPLTRMELQLAMMKKSDEINHLQEDVKELGIMVEEYLAFARGEEAESFRPTNFTELIQDLLAKMDNSQISFDSAAPSLTMTLKPHAMNRALKNLLHNALRYATQTWITLSGSPKTITLIVDDNGPGIPLDRREDVFNPFVRLDESRNAKTGGYGLGLSICKDIVNSHGGTIFLRDSPKGGLRVIIHLPR